MEFFALIGLGALGFWGVMLLLVAAIFLVYSAENDAGFLGTMIVLGTAVSAQFLFDVPVWQTIVNEPLTLVLGLVLYMLVGVAYTCVWAWPDFIRGNGLRIANTYNSWVAGIKRLKNDENKDTTFGAFLKSSDYREYTAARNKSRLGTWVFLWPFSLAWVLARRPAIALWDITYDFMGKTFDRIGKNTAEKAYKSHMK
jgi:hypothetical protein